MPNGMSLLDMLTWAAERPELTKAEFGRIMHDPDATETERKEAVHMMQEAGGYENLAD